MAIVGSLAVMPIWVIYHVYRPFWPVFGPVGPVMRPVRSGGSIFKVLCHKVDKRP